MRFIWRDGLRPKRGGLWDSKTGRPTQQGSVALYRPNVLHLGISIVPLNASGGDVSVVFEEDLLVPSKGMLYQVELFSSKALVGTHEDGGQNKITNAGLFGYAFGVTGGLWALQDSTGRDWSGWSLMVSLTLPTIDIGLQRAKNPQKWNPPISK